MGADYERAVHKHEAPLVGIYEMEWEILDAVLVVALCLPSGSCGLRRHLPRIRDLKFGSPLEIN
jgi:hypothetical protein